MALGSLKMRRRPRQPKREPNDNVGVSLRVLRGDDGQQDRLLIALDDIEGRNVGGQIIVSEHNAWTLFALLALFLGQRLPKIITENIYIWTLPKPQEAAPGSPPEAHASAEGQGPPSETQANNGPRSPESD